MSSVSFRKEMHSEKTTLCDDVCLLCQVHHDFEVKLAVGSETLAIGIPCLTSEQLQR